MSRTHYVGLPTLFRFNFGPASQPIAGEVTDRHPVYAAHRWFKADKSFMPLAHHSNTGSAVYLAAASQQKRAIHLMLAQRPRRWPGMETAF